MKRGLLLAALAVPLCAASPPVEFMPVRPELAPAAAEYRLLWNDEGERIVAALESATGLGFPRGSLEVLVSDRSSMTASDGRTMWLRASASVDHRRAALVHEMGHRIAVALTRPDGIDEHRLLNLFLYDVWTDLYGMEFAARMVDIERNWRRSPFDYDGAWDWALTMNRAQRQACLRSLGSGRLQDGNCQPPK